MYTVYTVSGACGGPMSRVLPLWQVDCEAAAHLNGSHFFWVHGAARDAASLEANIFSRQFPSGNFNSEGLKRLQSGAMYVRSWSRRAACRRMHHGCSILGLALNAFAARERVQLTRTRLTCYGFALQMISE
jgi:hypothetical protein